MTVLSKKNELNDFEAAARLGFNEKEWRHLVQRLQRFPSVEEAQMLGVMWSEHCSYKASKPALKKLFSRSKNVLEGPGENAGLIHFDEERALAFKIESHNHPSFVEPFQGAATGVGGILRDIFTMGARPVALGNFLRFGPLHLPKHQELLRGVISGISHYGNCVGVPMLTGQIHADASFEHNILVNVFALGIVDKNKIFRSNSGEPGHSIMIWGAKTGRDGIHGASLLASAEFDAENQKEMEQKIRVQVGDPFLEKCLLEACLEVMNDCSEDLLCIQDMGAAGLTCSTMEISDKSNLGMRIDLDRVPQREENMQAFELLLSESQERMLAVVRKGSEEKFRKILNRWQCEAEVIGETTDDGILKMFFQNEQVVDLPVKEMIEPPAFDVPEPIHLNSVIDQVIPEDIKDEAFVLQQILSLPRIANKQKIYERFDSSVGAATRFGPGAEAGVLWLGSEKSPFLGAAMKGAADEALAKDFPALAAAYSLTECIRALACAGAKALAYTDGINMGVPTHSKVQTALHESVRGMNEVAEIFDVPCVSGNVSLYNQTKVQGEARDIDPTVFVVAVGRVEDVRKCRPSSFQKSGNEVWLLEASKNPELFPHSSVYSREILKMQNTQPPFLDLEAEKDLQSALLEAHDLELFESIRDVTDGGLAVALAEACFQNQLGFEGDWSKSQQRRDFQLFDEAGGRVLVELDSSKKAALIKLSMKWKIEAKRIGSVMSDDVFRIRPLLNVRMSELKSAWNSGFFE